MKSTLRYKEKHDFNPLPGTDQIIIDSDSKLIKYDKEKNVAVVAELTNDKIIERYVKFISSALRLSSKAREVFKYILVAEKKSVDKVRINMDKLKEITGYNSLGPIYSGFNELVEKQMIARTYYGDQYFINPNFIPVDLNNIGVFNVLNSNVYTEKQAITEVQDDNEDSMPSGFDDKYKVN